MKCVDCRKTMWISSEQRVYVGIRIEDKTRQLQNDGGNKKYKNYNCQKT